MSPQLLVISLQFRAELLVLILQKLLGGTRSAQLDIQITYALSETFWSTLQYFLALGSTVVERSGSF